MRKRLLALLLTGVLLGLSACGDADTDESKEAGKVATEESKRLFQPRRRHRLLRSQA